MESAQYLEVEIEVSATPRQVWEFWTNPKHIVNWNFASEDWECPNAVNNLEIEKEFCFTMASKDGQFTFDYKGTYNLILPSQELNYTIEDGRKVWVVFEEIESGTLIKETFEPEMIHSPDQQLEGWSSILEQFKKYVESSLV